MAAVNGHNADTANLRQELDRMDEQIASLKQENNQLKSLLAHIPSIVNGGQEGIARQKLPAVSGEPSSQFTENVKRKKFPKSQDARSLIRDAILGNDFLKNFNGEQVEEFVDCMQRRKYGKGQFIVREGWPGTELFVTSLGAVEVRQKERKVRVLHSGVIFGELAILYNCTRTATVVALEDSEVWSLDRHTFQSIMMCAGKEKLDSYKQFLRQSSVMKTLPEETLSKIADCLEKDVYEDGEYIVREGGFGNAFYIIRDGKVEVTKNRTDGSGEEEHIRYRNSGDIFGELALQQGEETTSRTRNVIARGRVTCLVLEREYFQQLIGNLSKYQVEPPYIDRVPSSVEAIPKEFAKLTLDSFDTKGILGVGGFGRVDLVELKDDKEKTFALKCLRKKHIVETRQQEHIFNEKRIMMEVRSPYIARLYRTFRDSRYLYLLIEACLGGELWTVLRNKTRFDDNTARFYTACVVEAFEYLHSQGIVYRDLKPENLLLDARGYVKLVDFGFAKRIGFGHKTWTFCGTPEYVPPEIILNKGHSFSADYWSLGILIYELLTGRPPFTADTPMKTYNSILRGIQSITFPSRFPRNAYSIIRKLCRDNPAERLGNQKEGVNDIKYHRWFSGFNWAGLSLQTVTPPIVPVINDPSDLSNFDKFDPVDDTPAEDNSGWDSDF